MGNNRWLHYLEEQKKQQVLNQQSCSHNELEYGEILYRSPMVFDCQWLVAEFEGEYNVFVARGVASRRRLDYGASFQWRDSAMRFALEMFLVCCGKLTRTSRREANYA